MTHTTDQHCAARQEALDAQVQALPEIAQEVFHRRRGWVEMAGRVYHGSALRSLEEFVGDLSAIADSARAEIESLQEIVRSLADRVATQSELLSRRAEKGQ